MIKINILGKDTEKLFPIVMGIDFNKINLKFLLLSIVFFYISEFTLGTLLSKNSIKIQKKLEEKTGEHKKLVKENSTHLHLIERVKSSKKEEGQLKERVEKINKLIEEKINPKDLLLSLIKNVPKNLWFTSLKIDKDRKIIIKGMTVSYKDIGVFVSSANRTLFFRNTLEILSSETIKDDSFGGSKRIESFEISGSIQGFKEENLSE